MRDGLVVALAGEHFVSIEALVTRCTAIEDSWNRIGYVTENLLRRRVVNEIFNKPSPNIRPESRNCRIFIGL